MKYSSLIDNVRSYEWGLSMAEMFVFCWIYSVPSWADTILYQNITFYHASRNKAIADLPFVTDKPDTMYRHYKSLESKGLISLLRIDGRDYLLLTDKAKDWNTKQSKGE